MAQSSAVKAMPNPMKLEKQADFLNFPTTFHDFPLTYEES
ncbi:uncharacterized protein G2W53_020758 [Senna tora]|uniref:Uncharacterized protein n=1 Tax=Senna tora TaxID=362788 RepID=A0A834TRP8_9FABA|nr:uncharacterized protein G2W53_020758 [Senna tora]